MYLRLKKSIMESPAKCKKNADSQGFLNSVRFKNSSGVKKREVHKVIQILVEQLAEMHRSNQELQKTVEAMAATIADLQKTVTV